jgi:hypothetical protein
MGRTCRGIIQLFEPTAVMGLNVTQLTQKSLTGWTVPRPDVGASHQIPQSPYTRTAATFQDGWIGIKPNRGRRANHIIAAIILDAGVWKSRRKDSFSHCHK